MNIEARKIAMVKQILNINNEIFIKELEAKLIQLFPKYISAADNKKPENRQLKKDTLSPPITEIRSGVSLDKIVAEQQTIPITYEEIQQSNKNIKSKYSLAELLKTLN